MSAVGSEERIEALEAHVAHLCARVAELDARPAPAPARSAPTPPAPARPAPTRPAPARPAPAGPARPAHSHAPTAPSPEPSKWTAPGPPETPVWARADLEELLGGRILGLVGGVAVLLGIAFFVAVAIGRGWIDEPARIGLALAASLALTAGGALLYERRGRTQAALAMAGAGIAAIFLTLTAATQLYALVPAPVALAGALIAGATATVLAVRWNARTIGALGILGPLLAPVLVGAGLDDGSVAFLAVALFAAVGVLVWRRWDWLAVAAFAVTAPQLVVWVSEGPSTLALLVFPAVFWALFAGAAFGFELRVRAPRPRPSSVGLLLAAAALAAGIGWGGLDVAGQRALADGFLAALAGAHLALGVAALRARRVARAFGLVLVAGAIALGDIAFGLVLSGPVLAAGWAASAVLMAALARVAREDRDVLRLGLGAQLGLAAVHALAVDARPDALLESGAHVPDAIAALGLVALAAFACARLHSDRPEVRAALDVVAMTAVAYLTAFAFDGAALVAAWSAQAVGLGQVARRERDEVAAAGALGFLGLATVYAVAAVVPPGMAFAPPADVTQALTALGAVLAGAFVRSRQAPGSVTAVVCDALAATTLGYLTAVALDGPALVIAWSAEATVLLNLARRPHAVAPTDGSGPDNATPAEVAGAAAVGLAALAAAHVLVFEAPPDALVIGVDDLFGATGALVALALVGLSAARLAPDPAWRTAGSIAGAATLLYLGSVAIVSAFQPDAASPHLGMGGLEVGQQGQVLLSAFWGTVGLASLLGGLVARRRPARIAGLSLLVLAIGKVFAFDLASLDSMYRVMSLVGLGLLLLAGAFAWQRLRPGPPPAPAT